MAEKFGVKGVLLYHDPQLSAPSNTKVYPDGPYMPDEGTQWGSLYRISGDPLSPLYPSIGSL